MFAFAVLYLLMTHEISCRFQDVRGNASVVCAAETVEMKNYDDKESNMVRVRPLADDFVKIFESPDPQNVYCYSPGITRCPSGRLVATMDVGGPGVSKLPGQEPGNPKRGKVFTSDNHGKTWTHRVDSPMVHARPFMAGNSVYVLGHRGDLLVMRSDDEGETWTEPERLTKGQSWHQSACNVHYANGCVYLVMERRVYDDIKAWSVSAPRS